MKKFILMVVLLTAVKIAVAQTAGYNPAYRFVHSGNLVVDKNFYLLTLITHDPAAANLLRNDEVLSGMMKTRVALIKQHVTDTCSYPSTLVTDFKYTHQDSVKINEAVTTLYNNHRAVFDHLINAGLRPSGYYQRYVDLSNRDILLKAWAQYMYGTNYIIDQFGLGKKMRYPRIDSPNYVVTSKYYRMVLKDIFASLNEQTDKMNLFYQPSLSVALQLMQANDRDEPARFEPMEQKENKKAFDKIKQTKWANYTYAAIVIPGNGPELFTTPISPDNKIHCDVAAARYLQGLAPFIITSGGYCYPFRGPYCEAIEMKRYLMAKFNIPESAIIVDPHARHTTTNFRNANRLIIRYGIPVNKPSVFVTSKSQHDYVMNDAFDRRNKHELGYLPYRDKKSISNHDIVYYPVFDCLHMDPLDPLDP